MDEEKRGTRSTAGTVKKRCEEAEEYLLITKIRENGKLLKAAFLFLRLRYEEFDRLLHSVIPTDTLYR
jgi:hypothetical protein